MPTMRPNDRYSIRQLTTTSPRLLALKRERYLCQNLLYELGSIIPSEAFQRVHLSARARKKIGTAIRVQLMQGIREPG